MRNEASRKVSTMLESMEIVGLNLNAISMNFDPSGSSGICSHK